MLVLSNGNRSHLSLQALAASRLCLNARREAERTHRIHNDAQRSLQLLREVWVAGKALLHRRTVQCDAGDAVV